MGLKSEDFLGDVIYGWPLKQSYHDFESFLDNFELSLDTLALKNPF